MIVGHDEIVHGVLTCLFIGGHALLEGVPGLGKTLLVRTLADALALDFNRIQFTPDLMPADIIGTNVVMETPEGRRIFEFQKGPIFSQIVLADEINRATPKTQSALLEAMQEHSVTVGGQIHRLKEPFFVLATQNPIEQEGTYPLPEAQLDRFLFKLIVGYSTREELGVILDRTTRNEQPRAEKVIDGETLLKMQSLVREVIVAPHVQDYAIRLSLATHPQGPYAGRRRTSRSAGEAARAESRPWSWRRRCGRCSMVVTMSASRTCGASISPAFGTGSCSTSRPRPKGSMRTTYCSRCSTPYPRPPRPGHRSPGPVEPRARIKFASSAIPSSRAMHDIYDPPPAPVAWNPPSTERLVFTTGDVVCLIVLCTLLVGAALFAWWSEPTVALFTALGGTLVILESWFTALGYLHRRRSLGLRARWTIFLAALVPWLVGLGVAALLIMGLFLVSDWWG